MKFSFVTLFPSLIEFYFNDSILARAKDKGILSCEFYNPRIYTNNKHQKVDAPVVGGGAGMLMTVQPLFACLDDIKKNNEDIHIIFATPVAKDFKQNDAKRLAKKKHIVFVSGRYEGIDERVIEKYADEVFSIGEYVLTGGELPSLVMADAISRNIDEVLGNASSLELESYENNLLEAPSFAKPENFDNLSIIKEFSKGNHSKISDLKFQMSLYKTKYYKPNKEIR